MNIQLKNHKWGVPGALGLAAAFAAGVLASGTAPQLLASPHANAAITAPAPAVAGPATASYADAVSRVAPSVVTIQVEKTLRTRTGAGGSSGLDDELLQRFFGGNAPQNRRSERAPVQRGLGSGVIVSADGNVLTNNHVVEGADSVRVTLSDGREFAAKVLGTDPKTDLAVVHIDATDLPGIALADSDAVRVGDVVLAVGNPLGVGETVTMGIISAKGRTTDSGNDSYEDFLQTDAPINQGNSGGALVNASGQLIGINSQILSPSGGNIGIGFAIPSNMAKNAMAQLVATGHVRRALLGVSVQSVTSDQARDLHLKAVKGAVLADVTADGPAARAGLKKGDVVLAIDGNVISTGNDFRNRISALAPGSTVKLDISRDGKPQTVTVTLGELPETAQK